MNCAIHNKPMREGKFGPYCATKLDDGSWCKYKGPVKEAAPIKVPVNRNFDREAYEKCCSIWLAGELSREIPSSEMLNERLNRYWNYFQAIRADGANRFATGWQKAEAKFAPEPPPIEFASSAFLDDNGPL